ncbi:MAG: guanylate kinase [Opitutales bacterium]|nr:guanylate kinase [Opitutales bacterium]MCH8541647.1 guanylate kinase [Opitutales bacterium]
MSIVKSSSAEEGVVLTRKTEGLLFIVSGPAGSGKTTLCDRLLADNPEVARIVTATSRPPREGEVDGKDYYFFSEDGFRERIENGEFFEWARVHNHYYGCLRREVRGKIQENQDLLLNIDVQGATTFRKEVRADELLRGKLVTVFVCPPSTAEIRRRLEERGQDGEAEVQRRLKNAEEEIRQWRYYDYCLLSGTREEDYQSFRSIFDAEKMRNRQKVNPS